ncbi:MAG: phenylalanine--tRNA ligase subunit beta [Candidatus Nanoclepta minutus]|uniref:phenylalanine--tRNA ligase n=1 Tax=Candidatus Nanoclepta minutus TaxID=1940235 RepID=A0A397WMR1_9ARCH|nr:MAG: phenylalanine--tRNA ligase subunit beta [Candidatus Nanoclepta minutus]
MAVINVNYLEFSKLLGKRLSKEEIEEALMHIKCELSGFDGEYMSIEVKDFYRIDLLSLAGLVRELKGFFGIEVGIPNYKVEFSGREVIVDREVEKIRPFIACAIVEDIDMNEERLKDIIQMQDKISFSFGNRRKKIAIGTHNAELIDFPVYYKAVDPEEVSFVPLFEEREMSLREILEKTKTGKLYGNLLKGFSKYPVLMDKKGKVISFPPIINSNDIGRLTEETRNIFIDVTGSSLNDVIFVLNSIVTILADYGGKIKSLKIVYGDRDIITPDLRIISREFLISDIFKWIGISMDKDEIKDILGRKRINCKFNNDRIIVEYLNYRKDINTDQDVAEEIIVGYGINRLKLRYPSIYTKGSLTIRRKTINTLRKIMVSLGSIELYTTVLVNEDINKLFTEGEIIRIRNPASENYNSIRSSILSSVFQVMQGMGSIKLPAKLFEVGRVSYYEGGLKEDDRLLYLYLNSEVSFSDVLSVLERLFKEIKIDFDLKESNHKFLIEGRQADIYIGSNLIGWIGEINPEILEKLEIKYPVAGFEISVGELINKMKDDNRT